MNNPFEINKVVEVNEFGFMNKQGGTGLSNWKYDPKFVGVAKVAVIKFWYDYETGYRAIGVAQSKDLKNYLKTNASQMDQRVFVSQFDVKGA
jgi:hypothetical protein